MTQATVPEQVVNVPDTDGFRLTWLNFWIVVHLLLGAADLLFGIAVLLGFMGFEP